MSTLSARPLRRALTAAAATDPGLARLRLASTTIATIGVTLVAVATLVTATNEPFIVAIPAIVLAMVSSIAVRETEALRLAGGIVLLAPATLLGAGLGSLFTGSSVLAEAVFVAIAVVAVFFQRGGPSGTALGMVTFISFFLALFVALTPGQLPAVAGTVATGAAVCTLVRLLLRPRHPDRELRQMVTALGVRVGDVVELLHESLHAGRVSPRLAKRIRSRVSASAETATAVDRHLGEAHDTLLATIGNDELAVRIFDVELALETLVATVRQALAEDHDHAARGPAAGDLAALTQFLDASGPAPQASATTPDGPDARIRRATETLVEAWRRVSEPHPDDPDVTSSAGRGETDGEVDRPAPWSHTARQAAQVGLASALAIAAGTQLSSTRWFWAVITAFVVYLGTSTRGDVLSKGWQRVLGTLAGVVAGVLVASAVGGHTIVAVALIFACLFLGVYLLAISYAYMMFFITTMLALLYGLLGMFSVGLLLVRLEETAAGAVVGVLVSYVVFPTSTRESAREDVRDFLDELGDLLTAVADDLGGAERESAPPAGHRARELRETFQTLRTTATPLMTGIAGLPDRTDTRHTMVVLASCEHHGRLLSRLADSAAGSMSDPAVASLLRRCAVAVQTNLDAFATLAVDRSAEVDVWPATPLMDDLEDSITPGTPDHGETVVRHLRAIDRAVCDRAVQLGATERSGRPTDPTSPDQPPASSSSSSAS